MLDPKDLRWKVAATPDPLTPDEVEKGIQAYVARIHKTLPDIRVKNRRVSKSPAVPGAFEVNYTIEASDITTLVNVSFHPARGAWFQVASIWPDGRKQKNLDEKVSRSAQYDMLLGAVLTHLNENKPVPWA